MGRTIGELFRDPNSYRYGTNYSEVKSDTETLIEQETTGIRVKSLVDVNNPLIYGNQATRIALRSTPDLEKMKEGTITGDAADSGLIGGAITDARNFVNDKLGIPSNVIPTRVVDKIDSDLTTGEGGSKIPTSEPITKDLFSSNGTEFGKFLKQTGGGNPTTIGKQAIGGGIGFLKDKLRGALFGDGQSIGEAIGDTIKTEYSNENTYSSTLKDTSKPGARDIFTEGGIATRDEYKENPPIQFGSETVEKIDLRLVSPIYNYTRDNNRYGISEYAFQQNDKNENEKLAIKNQRLPDYRYRQTDGGKVLDEIKSVYQIGQGKIGGVGIEELSIADDYTLDEDDAFVKDETGVKKDLIPLWFRRKGSKKAIPFRAILTGLTETTSPSWSGQRFLGNPYQFYLYEGVERSITFSIKVVSENPTALASNWERLKRLTTYTYPTIKNGLSNPPVIEFRLGSMYSNRVSFIESLQYTIPDEGVWELNAGGLGYLPKFIDVSLTLKFIESDGAEDRVYDYDISKGAAKAINEKRESNEFSTETVNADGSISKFDKRPAKVSVNKKSEEKPDDTKTSKSIGNDKNPNIGSTDSSPEDIADKGSQSAVSDKLDGKTPAQAISEKEKSGITPDQARIWTSFESYMDKVEKVNKSQVPYGNEYIKTADHPYEVNSIVLHTTLYSTEYWYEVTIDGRQKWIWQVNKR